MTNRQHLVQSQHDFHGPVTLTNHPDQFETHVKKVMDEYHRRPGLLQKLPEVSKADERRARLKQEIVLRGMLPEIFALSPWPDQTVRGSGSAGEKPRRL